MRVTTPSVQNAAFDSLVELSYDPLAALSRLDLAQQFGGVRPEEFSSIWQVRSLYASYGLELHRASTTVTVDLNICLSASYIRVDDSMLH